MDLSDDLPPVRRPLFFPVVIATVFLSVIGMSAGLVLGARDKRAAREAQQQQQQQQQQQPEGPVAQPTEGYDARPECREETQRMGADAGATGTLRIALLLRTASTAVWICEDASGRLYYHANRGGEQAPWLERETALFLPDVQRDGDDAYEVRAADGTRFSITPKRLFIVHSDGRQEVQSAIG
ncbi:hypothetical protein [Jidongwangia harbinensis]|uniref:hypothetical protein n=1 Tax=Jidongwangia harbinensis TaxID=2878561 RepID=UPI001CD97AB2|nr:hypothetical protein [Jidongwangia harbinensis]MCA2216758.1 hypothetical protein [Jidongwangia harbinensis]